MILSQALSDKSWIFLDFFNKVDLYVTAGKYHYLYILFIIIDALNQLKSPYLYIFLGRLTNFCAKKTFCTVSKLVVYYSLFKGKSGISVIYFLNFRWS